MKELQIEQTDVAQLAPWPQNPRKHGEPDLAVIIRSIKEYGFTNPILVQRGTNRVIAGHGRLQAAKKMGMVRVPVLFLDIDDAKATALTIMDNRSAELSTWDMTALKDCLVTLDDGAFDVELTGFTKDDVAKLFAGPEDEDPESDEAPPAPKPVKCPKCGNTFTPKKKARY